MSDDLEGTPHAETPARPDVHLDVDDESGEGIIGATREAGSDDYDWSAELRQLGFDPDTVEIVGPVESRVWDQASQDGGVQTMRYLRARVRVRDDASDDDTAEILDLKMGKVAQPLRVAITGSTASPAIDETLALVGRDRTIARIERAQAKISAEAA